MIFPNRHVTYMRVAVNHDKALLLQQFYEGRFWE